MADVAILVADLLQDAADSQHKIISYERTLSFVLASQFFSDGVIYLSTVSYLVHKHLQKSIPDGRLINLLQTTELQRVCKVGSRSGSIVVTPSNILAQLIAAKSTNKQSIHATNGTDIETYSNKYHNSNNTNLNESDRIARMFNDELTCVVCMDTLVDAVESSCCKTMCCLECSGKCHSCPMCRKQSITWTANEPIRRIVGKKPAKCPHKDCSLWSTSAEITVHKEKCEHRVVQCTNKGCSERMKYSELTTHTSTKCRFRYDTCHVCKGQMPRGASHNPHSCNWDCGKLLCNLSLDSHKKECINRPVRCTNRDCKEEVPKQSLQHHLHNTCPYRVVTCPNNKCDVRMFACTISKHTDICPEARVNCKHCNIPCYRKNLDRHEGSCKRRPRFQCAHCSDWYYQGEHQPDTCPDRFVTCPNDVCTKRVKAKNLERHFDNCQFSKLPCNNLGCDKEVFLHQLYVHENEQCPFRGVECKSCGEDMPAWQLKSHECDENTLLRKLYIDIKKLQQDFQRWNK